MRRKKRSRLTFVFLGLALAAVITAVLLLTVPSAPVEQESQKLFAFSPGDVTFFSLEREGELLTFQKGEEGWFCSEYPDFPLEGSYIEAVVAAMAELVPVRVLDSDQSAEIPLTQKTVEIAAEAKGQRYTLSVYGLNHGTHNFYAHKNGGQQVYLISNTSIEPFEFGLYDVARLENLGAVLSTDVVSLKISLPKGDGLELFYFPEGEPRYDYCGTATWFYRAGGTLRPADVLGATSVLDGVQNIKNERLAEYEIDDSHLDKYRLSENYIEIVFKYRIGDSGETKEIVKRIASIHSGELIPVYTEDSQNIYFTSHDLVDELVHLLEGDMERHEVLGLELDSLTGFDISRQGNKASYTLEHSDDGQGNSITSLYRDGIKCDSEGFVSLFFGLKSIIPQALSEGRGQQELFTLTLYTDNSFAPSVKVTVREYDSSFYALQTVDDAPLLLNRRTVDSLMDYVNQLTA